MDKLHKWYEGLTMNIVPWQVAFYMKDTERMYLCLSQERIIQFQVNVYTEFEFLTLLFINVQLYDMAVVAS